MTLVELEQMVVEVARKDLEQRQPQEQQTRAVVVAGYQQVTPLPLRLPLAVQVYS